MFYLKIVEQRYGTGSDLFLPVNAVMKRTKQDISSLATVTLILRFDLSLFDHKGDLIYCQWNTTEPGAVRYVCFLM